VAAAEEREESEQGEQRADHKPAIVSGSEPRDQALGRRMARAADPRVRRREEALDVHLIMDNYATHKTALIQRWLAKRPRYHLHFTPKGPSWINLVERWFALLTEKQLRRGIHRSTRELVQVLTIEHIPPCVSSRQLQAR
jgi:transposase